MSEADVEALLAQAPAREGGGGGGETEEKAVKSSEGCSRNQLGALSRFHILNTYYHNKPFNAKRFRMNKLPTYPTPT